MIHKDDANPNIKDTERWHRAKFTGLNENFKRIKELTLELYKLEIEESRKKIERLTNALAKYRDRQADKRRTR